MPLKDSPIRPTHRRAVSSMSIQAYTKPHSGDIGSTYPAQHTQFSDIDFSSTNINKTSSRLITSVRRTIGSIPKRRGTEPPNSTTYGMTSTPAEQTLPTRHRDYNPSSSRPTIEQIAIGLHTSRTPHLRPLNSSPSPYSHSHRSASPVVLPPPPARSSLKQPNTGSRKLVDNGSASASSTTVTSNNPPTLKSSTSSISSIKVRMARLLPRSRTASAPPSVRSSATSSPRTSAEFPTPKKAVRFSTQVQPVSLDD